MSDQIITIAEVYEMLRSQIKEAGSNKAFADRAGVSPGFITNILAYRKPISEKVLDALGIKRHEIFIKEKTNE